MRKLERIHYAFLIGILCILAPFYWYQAQPIGETKNTITVICTTSMIADAVRNIGKDNLFVHGLMGPGIDPHVYRARESDVHLLSSADLIFYNGLDLEGKIGNILANMTTYCPTVAVTEKIPRNRLISSQEFGGIYDPHFWFDIDLWIEAISYMRDTLVENFPSYKEQFTLNTKTYIERLKTLDNQLKTMAKTLPQEQRVLVTAHDAFGYFGRKYDFQVVSLLGISTDAQAGSYDISKLVSFIVSHKIRAIFTETIVPDRMIKSVQNAAQSRDWQVLIGPELYSDALGPPDSGADSYITMMQYNMHAIVHALSTHSQIN